MTDTANPAGSFGQPIADRIAQWCRENPEATEYCINEEIEAKELLLAIAATIKVMMRDISHKGDLAQVKVIRNGMCAAAAQGRALDYIREMDDDLEFLGVTITVPEVTIQ